MGLKFGQYLFLRKVLSVASVGIHGIKRIRYSYYTCYKRNILSGKALHITFSVIPFMMVECPVPYTFYSGKILEDIAGPNVLAFAATHDIELSYLLEGTYTNWHFEESVTDEEVTFDYKLREGRATSRNAIRLLKVMGFDEKIVEGAGERARTFDAEGIWK